MKNRIWIWTLAAAFGALGAQPATADISVYGEATSAGPTITVNLYADIVTNALVSFGVNLAYPPADLYVTNATKNTALWYLAANGVQYAYVDPDTSVPGQVVLLGARLDGNQPLQGVSGMHVLLGSVTFGRTTHNTPAFGLTLGRPAAFANFVSTNGIDLDSRVGGVILGGVTADPNDTKLIGIPDAWQLRYFGSVGTIWWSDDPDHDGFSNLQEYEADTNPTDSASFLGLSGANRVAGGVMIKWHGGVQATQVLQRRFTLGAAESWVNIFTNPAPTAITASYVDPIATNGTAFYRITASR